MKRITLLLFMLTIISSVWSQEEKFERKGGFGNKPPSREMHHLRFAKHILSERCIEEAKITPEQVNTLKRKFELLDNQMVEIGKIIEEESKRQAEISVKVLTTPGSDPQEMLNLTEKIGKLRTEQAKLSVKVLILIRDTLQPEQCAKVVELMKEERDKMRRRMEFMREKMQNRHGGSREDGFRERLPENEPPPVGEPGQEGNDGV